MKRPSTNAGSPVPKFHPANSDDVDHIVRLLIPLFVKVGAAYGIRPEVESIVKTVMHTVKRGVCLVGPTACAGGFIHPYPWNHDVQLGVILFWNWTKPSGIKVFEAMVQAFKAHGATHINCASHFPDNLIGRFYHKQGAYPAEIQYVGKILQAPGFGTNKDEETMSAHPKPIDAKGVVCHL